MHSTPNVSHHYSLPLLARLVISGFILHVPSLRRFLPHLPYPLLLNYFSLFPPKTTTFLFNILIQSQCRGGGRRTEEAMSIFASLLLHSHPDRFTFPILLKSVRSLPLVHQIHTQILRRGFLHENYVLNSLLTMYSYYSDMYSAKRIFDSSRRYSDVVSWNIILNGYVKNGSLDLARNLFDGMPIRNEVSWSAMIGGYAGSGELDVARCLFDKMPAAVGRNTVTWNSMVSGFARSGLLDLARRYFDNMPERNLVSWNSMVSGYASNGEMGLARELFAAMPERDVVSWSCMIAGYVQSGHYFEALHLFKKMHKECSMEPNEITMVSVLSACAHLSALNQGKWVHRYVDRKRMILDDDCNLGAALIDMYSKCGSVESAIEIFSSLDCKNISSWNALITGMAINGLACDALLAFEEMQRSMVKPNDITFVGVLTACSHGGLVEEGRQYFGNMSVVYAVQPKMKHYGCMVDLLGRAGLLEEAEGIVRRMPMKPDVMVLGALLGACRIHRNTQVAKRVGMDFLELKSQQAGCHVLLSNIYAAADRWADASKMRGILKKNSIRKEAGSSFVKFDGVE